MADGRRVPLSTRVSEARAKALDDVRGDMTVSEALDTALGYWITARHRALRRTAPGGDQPSLAARAATGRDAALKVPFSGAEQRRG